MFSRQFRSAVNSSRGDRSVTLNGSANNSSGQNAIAGGTSNTASGQNSIALGTSNTANGSNSIVLGSRGSTSTPASDGSFVFSATSGFTSFAAKGPRGFFVRAPGSYDLSTDGVNKYTIPASGSTTGVMFQLDDVVSNGSQTRNYVAGISYTRPQESGPPATVGSISYFAESPNTWVSNFGVEPGNVSHALDVLSSASTAVSLASAGAGTSLVSDGSAPTLATKSLTTDGSLTVTSTPTEVSLVVTNPYQQTNLSSVGTGASLVNDGSGPTLATKSLKSDGSLTVTSAPTEVSLVVTNPYQQTNLTSDGSGASLVSDGSGPNIATKSLTSDGSLTITSTPSEVSLVVANPYQQTTLSSAGVSSLSLVDDGSGPTLATKGLAAGTDVTLTDDAVNKRIIISAVGGSSVVLSSAGAGASLVSDGSGPTLATKSLTTDGSLTITGNSTEVSLVVANPYQQTNLASVGSGASLINDGSGPTLATKSLATGGSLTITSTPTEVFLDVADPYQQTNLSSVGTGASLVSDGSGPTLATKSLTTDGSMTIIGTSTEVSLIVTDPYQQTNLSSVGTGASLVSDGSGPTIATKSLTTDGSMTIIETSTEVSLVVANPYQQTTLSSAGVSSLSLVDDGSGPTLATKGLAAGTDVTLTDDAVNKRIIISAAGASSVVLSSAGAGESLVSDGSGPTIATKSLTSDGSLNIIGSPNEVSLVVADPYQQTNLTSAGAGESLVSDGSGPTIATKSLTSDGSLTITGTSTEVSLVVADPYQQTNLTSVGAGESLVSDGSGPTIATKSLTSDGSLTITGTSTEVSLVVANPYQQTTLSSAGVSSLSLVDDGSGPTLATKGLAAGANVTLTDDAVNKRIIISAAGSSSVVLASVGSGESLVSNGSGPTLETKSLTSDGSLTITGTSTEVSLVITDPYQQTNLSSAGAGESLVSDGSGPTIATKSLTSDGSLTITGSPTEVSLVITDPYQQTNLSSAGAGESLVSDGSGPTIATKSLTSDGSLTITGSPTEVSLVVANPYQQTTLSSAGISSLSLVDDGSGPTLATKGLSAGTDVTLTDDAVNKRIIISAAGASSVVLSSDGSGASLVSNGSGPNISTKSLTSTDGSLTITETSTEVSLEVANPYQQTNLTSVGAGESLVSDGSGPNIATKSLTSDGSLTITGSSTEVSLVVADPYQQTNLSSAGAGESLVSDGSGPMIATKSLTTDGSLTITGTSTEVSLVVADPYQQTNLTSAGAGESLVSDGSGPNIATKSLTSDGSLTITGSSTEVSLVITDPYQQTNLTSAGAGESLVSDGSGPTIATKSLTSDGSLTITGSSTEVLLAITDPYQQTTLTSAGISSLSLVDDGSGPTLATKGLAAGTDVTLTDDAVNKRIIISAAGASSVVLSSVGAGESLVSDGSGPTLETKSLTSDGSLTITASSTEVSLVVADPYQQTNLTSAGAGESLVSDGSGPNIATKSLTSDGSLTITGTSNEVSLVVANPYQQTTLSSAGISSLSLVDDGSGPTLATKGLAAGTDVTLTDDAVNKRIIISAAGASSVVLSSVGAGESLVSDGSGPTLETKSLTSDGSLTITSTPTEVSLVITDPYQQTNLTSDGAGESLVSDGSGPSLATKSLTSDGSLTITSTPSEVSLVVANPYQQTTLSSAGISSLSLVDDGYGPTLATKGLAAGVDVTLTDDAVNKRIIISAAGASSVVLSSDGSGASLVSNGSGPSLATKSLTTDGSLTITETSTEVSLVVADPYQQTNLTSAGAGESLVSDGSGPTIATKSLTTDGSLTITSTPSEVSLVITDPYQQTNLTSDGSGASLVSDGSGPNIATKSLTTDGSLTITSTPTEVSLVITDPYQQTTLLSAGISSLSLVDDGSGPTLATKGLAAGTNVTLTDDAVNKRIIISASGTSSVVLSSVGAGESLVSNGSGPTLETKSLTSDGSLTITSTPTEVSLVVADPYQQTNLTSAGAGESLVSDGSGPTIATKSLTSDGSLTITGNSTEVSLVVANPYQQTTLSSAGVNSLSLVDDGSGPTLATKGLAAGTDVTLTDDAVNKRVIITAAGASSVVLSSDGSGESLVSDGSGPNIATKSLTSDGSLTITSTPTEVSLVVADPYQQTNLTSAGAGESLVSDGSGPTIATKSLTSDGSLTITSTPTEVSLVITDPYQQTNLTSAGAGESLVSDGSGPTIATKSLTSDGSLTITASSTEVSLVVANPYQQTTLTSAGISSLSLVDDGSGPTLATKSLASVGSLTITSTPTEVFLDVTDPYQQTNLSSVGTGASLVNDGSGPNIATKSLTSDGSLTITGTSTEVSLVVADPYQQTNLTSAGAGESLVSDGSGPTIATKSLTSDGSLTITSTPTEVSLVVADPYQQTILSSTGSGESLVSDGSGPTIATKSLLSGGSLTITSTPTEVLLDVTDPYQQTTLSSAGISSLSLVDDGSGPTLATKGLAAGTDVTLTDDAVNKRIIISAAGASSVVLSSDGSGESLVSDGSGPNIATKSLTSDGSLTITGSSTEVSLVVADPYQQTILSSAGAGESLVSDGSGPTIATKSLTSDGSLTITASSTEVSLVVANPYQQTTLSSAGVSSLSLVDDGSGPTLATKGLSAGTDVTLTDDAVNKRIIINAAGASSVVLASDGSGESLVSDGSGPNIATKSLTSDGSLTITGSPTEVSLVVADPYQQTILSSAGAGESLVSDGYGPTISTKSLTSDGSLTITASSTEVSLVVANPYQQTTLSSAGVSSLSLVDDGSGPTLATKGLAAGTDVTLTDDAVNKRIIITAAGASSVVLASDGSGASLVSDGSGPNIATKSLTSDGSLTITGSPTEVSLVVANPYQQTTLSSAGISSLSLVDDGSGPTLATKGLSAGTDVTLTDDAPNKRIVINAAGASSVSLANAGTGGLSLVSGGTGPSLSTKSVIAGTDVTLTDDTPNNRIVINAAGASSVSLANAGTVGSVSLVNAGTGPNLKTKGLTAGTNITLTDDTANGQVIINSSAGSTTVTNAGAGQTLIASTSAAPNYTLNSITAVAPLSLTLASNNIALGMNILGSLQVSAYNTIAGGPVFTSSINSGSITWIRSTLTGSTASSTSGLLSYVVATPGVFQVSSSFTGTRYLIIMWSLGQKLKSGATAEGFNTLGFAATAAGTVTSLGASTAFVVNDSTTFSYANRSSPFIYAITSASIVANPFFTLGVTYASGTGTGTYNLYSYSLTAFVV